MLVIDPACEVHGHHCAPPGVDGGEQPGSGRVRSVHGPRHRQGSAQQTGRSGSEVRRRIATFILKGPAGGGCVHIVRRPFVFVQIPRDGSG